MRPVKKLVESRGFLGGLVLVMALITVFVTASQSLRNSEQAARDKQISDCQTRYNRALAQNITVKAALADQERAANKALNQGTFTFIKGVVTPTPGLTQAQKVARFERLSQAYIVMYQSYVRTEARIDSERSAHPVPKLSISACL